MPPLLAGRYHSSSKLRLYGAELGKGVGTRREQRAAANGENGVCVRVCEYPKLQNSMKVFRKLGWAIPKAPFYLRTRSKGDNT